MLQFQKNLTPQLFLLALCLHRNKGSPCQLSPDTKASISVPHEFRSTHSLSTSQDRHVPAGFCRMSRRKS